MLGAINYWFDTTDGCVGLATDAAIDAVAAWTSRMQATTIVIE